MLTFGSTKIDFSTTVMGNEKNTENNQVKMFKKCCSQEDLVRMKGLLNYNKQRKKMAR